MLRLVRVHLHHLLFEVAGEGQHELVRVHVLHRHTAERHLRRRREGGRTVHTLVRRCKPPPAVLLEVNLYTASSPSYRTRPTCQIVELSMRRNTSYSAGSSNKWLHRGIPSGSLRCVARMQGYTLVHAAGYSC